MTRNKVRNYFVLGCLVSLSLLNLLWPSQASEQIAAESNMLDAFVARNIGPSNMSGRTVAITGVSSDPKTVYAGTASGGLWKTTDAGETWAPIFDNQSSVSIGDVAVSKSNPNIVWVGTGEHNPRNSVAWGDGVYKSTDGGKSWMHMGLKDSHSIGRIAIHPTNPDIVYVAVLGHIWGPNKERGIFKTTDGGKTWQVSKFLDENTGFIDLKIDPTDPDTLYGCAYCVRRDAFSGGDPAVQFGPLAGMYKTSDGGETWVKMTAGLPTVQMGRCGVDIYAKDPNIVYAVVQSAKAKGGSTTTGAAGKSKGDAEVGGIFRSDDKGKTWKQLNTLCPRPFYYGQIRVDPTDNNRICILGVFMYISNDGGNTFEQFFTNQLGNDNLPHADHHAMWINPQNTNVVYEGNDGGIYISKDKGKNFKAVRAMAIGQLYGISVDMSNPYYVYAGYQDNGGWGGPSANRTDGGIRRSEVFYISGGDGFHTQNDPTDPNIVYTESQNGGLQRVNALAKKANTSGFAGGAGAGAGGKKGGKKGDPGAKKDEPGAKKDEPGIKKDDPNIKKDKKDDIKKDDARFDDLLEVAQQKDPQKKDEPKKDEQKKDAPKKDTPQKGGKGGGGGGAIKPAGNNRWNWSTPMLVSPHDPKTFFTGSQFLYMSTERGSNPKQISPDLTYGDGAMGAGMGGGKGGGKGGGGGGGAHSLFTIGESPVTQGVLWTGSDDGRIHVSKDMGKTWTDVSKIPGMPKDSCISRVEPSHFGEGTCYVSVTRYRNDDRKPYIFKTTDFGATWTNITSNLPIDGSVHVVIDSSKNQNLLFCGTEFGLFASLNGGQSWRQMKGGLPTVAVHDLVIHPRERDLVIGTHGRSIFVIDDISPLEQMTPQVLTNTGHLFEIRPALAFKVKKGPAPKKGEFVGENPPYGSIIRYQVQSTTSQPVSITIHDAAGKQVANLNGDGRAGMHQVVWNLRADGEQEATVEAGEYFAVLWIGSFREGIKLRVEAEK